MNSNCCKTHDGRIAYMSLTRQIVTNRDPSPANLDADTESVFPEVISLWLRWLVSILWCLLCHNRWCSAPLAHRRCSWDAGHLRVVMYNLSQHEFGRLKSYTLPTCNCFSSHQTVPAAVDSVSG